MEKYPKVAIIILNWNGLRDTVECLHSLKNTDYPDCGIILVDNGSKTEDVEELERRYGRRTLLVKNGENLGFAEGNNVAIRLALKDPKVGYVFLLNNDTTVDPAFLKEAVNRAAESGADMVATRMMKFHTRNEVDSLGVRLTRGGLAFNIKNPDTPVFCPCGGAALYSRRLLEAAADNGNYFDPDYFCYAEDLDLGFRARLLGFECARADRSVVFHKGSASTSVMSDFAVYHTYRNIIWTLAKNLPTKLLLKHLPFLTIGQKAICLLYLFRAKPKLILRAFWHGLRKIPKLTEKRKRIQAGRKTSDKELEKFIDKGIF